MSKLTLTEGKVTMTQTTKRKTSRQSVAVSDQLGKIARRIRDHYDTAGRLVANADNIAKQAIAEVILCGQALNEAKALVPHGEWGSWLAKHCKGVSEKTCQNYLRLSKAQHVADLSNAKTLRQAYILAGIIREADEPTAVHPESRWPQSEPVIQSHTSESKSCPLNPAAIPSLQTVKVDGDQRVEVIKRIIDDLLEQLKHLPDTHRDRAAKAVTPLARWLSSMRGQSVIDAKAKRPTKRPTAQARAKSGPARKAGQKR